MPEQLDLSSFAAAFGRALQKITQAEVELGKCGLRALTSPTAGAGRTWPSGEGHVAAVSNHRDRNEDDVFEFALTWIEAGPQRGWTVHCRPKHRPLPPDLKSAMDFIHSFSRFEQCPEFDFGECFWYFTQCSMNEPANRDQAGRVQTYFGNMPTHFVRGLQELVAADAELEPHGFRLLPKTYGAQPQ